MNKADKNRPFSFNRTEKMNLCLFSEQICKTLFLFSRACVRESLAVMADLPKEFGQPDFHVIIS
jgi:hypothetical protein